MLGKQFAGNEGVKAVHKWKIDDTRAAMFFSQFVMFAIESVTGGEIGIAHDVGPEDFAILECRHARLVQRWQSEAIGSRHDFQLGCEPTDTELFLEQRINTVKRPARLAACDDQAFAISPQNKSIRAEFGKVRLFFEAAEAST